MIEHERPSAESGGPTGEPLRIVFSLLHAGYLRHYGEPIRILTARGHTVHLALQSADAKDRGDDQLLKTLVTDCPSVTVGSAPRRHRLDGWGPIAWTVRSFVDVLRYSDPRYRDAKALRRRAAAKMRERVAARGIDPLSRLLLRRLVSWSESEQFPGRARTAARLLTAVEDAIPPSRRTTALLVAQRADLVLASPVVDFGSAQVEFVKSARRLGIPSAVCVASWDNLTNKGLLRVVPDRVLVWNEHQRAELAEMHGVPPERVVVTGGQKFDPWFELEARTTREEFAGRVGLDPARPYVLYVCSSSFVAGDEVPAVRRWIGALRDAGGALGELGVLVRPHPQNAEPWRAADLSEFANVSIWPRDGAYPDEGADRAGFYDSIFHSTGVVGVNTSAQIEAGIIGRPVFTILAPEFAATQTGTLHVRYLLPEHGGFVHEAADLETHLAQLRTAAEGGDDSGRIDAFIESFVRPRGRSLPVAPIVADELERLGREAPEPDGGRVRRAIVRAALTPLALGLSGLAALAGRSKG
jgi:hypothetical protein